MLRRLIGVGLVACLACGGGDGGDRDGGGERPVAVWRLSTGDDPLAFFDLPWPTDLRRTADGTIDAMGFPNLVRAPLVNSYRVALTGEVAGYSTNGAVYFRFSEPPDPSTLPADAAASREEASTVVLVDVDPESAERGLRRPVRLRFQGTATAFWAENTLAVLPVHGFVLRPRTRYAAVLRRGIATMGGVPFERDDDLDEIVSTGGDVVHDAALDVLEEIGIPREEILSIAVFTTQDPTEGLFAGADVIREEVPSPTAGEWFRAEVRDDFTLVIGRWEPVPIFQTGSPPFLESGGTFELDAAGRPIVQALENGRFALTVPRGELPPDGCPVVIYAHGTGGDYTSFTRDGTAANLAARGMCVMGFDQVLHGERSPPGDTSGTMFFNYLNPVAGRDNARQAALDVVQQARLASSGLVVPGRVLPEGVDVPLDATKVLFMGHSQGGLNGPLFLAADGSVLGAVFSGAGGGLNISLVEKKEPFDILAIVGLVLDVDPEEEGLDPFHPIATIAQTLAEPADVLNYARHWFLDPAPGNGPRSVLMTEGLLDEYTPPAAIEALAVAGGLPLVEPAARPIEGLTLSGIDAVDPPVRANAPGGVTAGLLQFPEDGHFAVFRNERAKERYGEFLRSLADDGVGRIPE